MHQHHGEPPKRCQDGPVISVCVALPDGRAYEVMVGAGVRHQLAQVVNTVVPRAKRAAVVTQTGIGDVLDPGIEQRTFLIGDGEGHKRLSSVEKLCSSWSQWGVTRNDVVIAVGGGIVTDVAGFAASCYLRGVAVIYVSTTLLGMIDAAVGGKTGVNLAEGKNLVGAFWQPSAVLCDTEFLDTLSERERRCGLGEMAKYHFLGGADLDTLPLEQRVARCVELKAAVVAADERESGVRATLNYGHTLAHALEIHTHHHLRHGEAVAVGLIFAAELAHRLGRIDAARVAEHRRIVGAYGLSMTLPPGADDDTLVTLMGRDKKALDGITFVLDGPRGVEPVTGVARCDIDAALAALR